MNKQYVDCRVNHHFEKCKFCIRSWESFYEKYMEILNKNLIECGVANLLVYRDLAREDKLWIEFKSVMNSDFNEVVSPWFMWFTNMDDLYKYIVKNTTRHFYIHPSEDLKAEVYGWRDVK